MILHAGYFLFCAKIEGEKLKGGIF